MDLPEAFDFEQFMTNGDFDFDPSSIELTESIQPEQTDVRASLA